MNQCRLGLWEICLSWWHNLQLWSTKPFVRCLDGRPATSTPHPHLQLPPDWWGDAHQTAASRPCVHPILRWGHMMQKDAYNGSDSRYTPTSNTWEQQQQKTIIPNNNNISSYTFIHTHIHGVLHACPSRILSQCIYSALKSAVKFKKIYIILWFSIFWSSPVIFWY